MRTPIGRVIVRENEADFVHGTERNVAAVDGAIIK